MAYDPDVAEVVALLVSMPSVETYDPAGARARPRAVAAVEPVAVASVVDTAVDGPAGPVPVRAYLPPGSGEGGDPPPVVAFFHGGGWVICDLDTHDDLCRALCARSGCAVVSVDYRLAPEHPFPAAPEDCFAVVRWLAAHGAELGVDPTRLAVAGDSAGGNLAAVVCLMARDAGGPPIAFQALLYPVTDFDRDTPSFRRWGEGGTLTTAAMRWYDGHYLADEAHRDHPHAAPLRAGDLSGLPPALVVTAENDPLADEGDRYAARLAAAGVPTVACGYPGAFHGFASFWRQLARSEAAVDQVAAALRLALGADRPEPS